MRIAGRVAVLGLLLIGGALAGCATFCDQEDDPYDPFRQLDAPLTEYEEYDRRGSRCVSVTIFDVVGGAGNAGRAP